MFERRWALWTVGVTAAVFAVFAGRAWWQGAPRPWDGVGCYTQRLKVENFPQVKAGMTRAEVEELLGWPPGNYGYYSVGVTTMSLEGFGMRDEAGKPVALPESRNWYDTANCFEIYFDDTDRVLTSHKRRHFKQTPGPGFFERLWRSVVGPPKMDTVPAFS